MHIKKNDTVVVIAGRDKGKKARLLMVFPFKSKALVEGVNYVKKHERKSQKNQQGGIVQREMPIQLSNLSLFCPKCNKGVRTSVREMADGTKSRFCKKCGEVI